MRKIVLENFAKMTGGYRPGVNSDLYHRYISGFIPHYEALGIEGNDSNFRQKIIPQSPLVLAPELTPIPNVVDSLATTLGASTTWAYSGLALNPAVAGVNPRYIGTPTDGSDDASGTTTTISVTVPDGENKTLIVFGSNPTFPIPISATFDGDAMAAVKVKSGSEWTSIFKLDGVVAKTGDVVVTWNFSASDRAVSAIVFEGVNQSDSVDVFGASGAATTSATLTLATTDPGVTVAGVVSSLGAATHTGATSQIAHTTELTGDSGASRYTMYSTPLRDEFPTVMVPNEHDSLEEMVVITNLWRVRVHDADSTTDLGIPTGAPASNTAIDAVIFNGKILTSHPLSSNLYYGEIDTTPNWQATSGETLASGSTHVLKLFEDRCLVVNASSGTFTRRDEVLIVEPDWSIIDGISLGDTFDIQEIGNYQDRYALLFTQKTTSPRLIKKTTVFMWNGVEGDPYDQKFLLDGVFRCLYDNDGPVYAFTQSGSTLICSVFEGAGFREVGRLKNVFVSRSLFIPKTQVYKEGDFFVLLASSTGNTSSSGVPLYWNPFTGDSFFVTESIGLAILGNAAASEPSSPFSLVRYFAYKDASEIGQLYSLVLENETKSILGAKYKSNFIPIPPIEGKHDGAMGRININKVEIEYSEKPPTVNDSIAFTLTSKDEHESETYNVDTATIKDTTANSTDAGVTAKRAIIKLGRSCTEFAIDLDVTVASTDWNLIIRRIVVYYEPKAIKQ